MLIYLEYFLTTLSSIFIFYYLLLCAQQNHYHFNYLIKYYKKYLIRIDGLLYLISFIRLFKFSNIINLFFDTIYICILFFLIAKKIYGKTIIPLKITSRIKRNIIVNVLISVLTMYIFSPNIYILLVPCISLLSFIVLEPIEKLVKYTFIRKAKKKIENIKPLIIGITGSAGKTSVKNFIYTIIKDKKITYASPKSYNTLMGLCRFINEEVHIGTEVLILEYGASHKGDIEKLVRFIKPDIGIITNVLPQHIETFKNIETIKKEKEKLLRNSRVCIYNSDILSINNLNNLVIKIGKKNSDLLVSDVVIDGSGSCFMINGIKYQTSLLGKCNYENILLAIACSLYIGIDINEIIDKVKNLEQVENRLEIKKVYNEKEIIIINDSFNSNIEGFKNALEVLSFMEGLNKVIITPGIVECGKLEKVITEEVVENILKYNMDVFLIESTTSKKIAKMLSDNEKQFIKFKVFQDAYQKALSEKYDVILIENDVSDIYLK